MKGTRVPVDLAFLVGIWDILNHTGRWVVSLPDRKSLHCPFFSCLLAICAEASASTMAALHLASWIWEETLQVELSGFEVSFMLSHMFAGIRAW